MLAGAVVVDLGDAVANGVAAFAAVVSIIALFVADSRAKDANEIALDANETSREARDIAKSAHQRTVEHYEHIESQDLERIQAEFKELTTPHLAEMTMLMERSGFRVMQASNKVAHVGSLRKLVKRITKYTFTVTQKMDLRQTHQFASLTEAILEAQGVYIKAHDAFRQEYEADLADVEQASVDEDHTGRLRVAKQNLYTLLMIHYDLIVHLNFAEDYREEMNRIPTIVKENMKSNQNYKIASPADSAPD